MPGSYTPPMKAAVCTRYGPPEVVVISEVEKPVTGDNGLLVKVHATTVNRTDCAYRAARPFFMRFLTGLIRPRPTVLGTEFAGVVEAVGSGVTSFGVGDQGSWARSPKTRSVRSSPRCMAARRSCSHSEA